METQAVRRVGRFFSSRWWGLCINVGSKTFKTWMETQQKWQFRGGGWTDSSFSYLRTGNLWCYINVSFKVSLEMVRNLKHAIGCISLSEVKFEIGFCQAILLIISVVFLCFWRLSGRGREAGERNSSQCALERNGEEFLGKVAMADILSALLESILAC